MTLTPAWSEGERSMNDADPKIGLSTSTSSNLDFYSCKYCHHHARAMYNATTATTTMTDYHAAGSRGAHAHNHDVTLMDDSNTCAS